MKLKAGDALQNNLGASSDISVNEQVLKECHLLYTADKWGLITIGCLLGLPLAAPKRRITVLLIGNHSAGKSSFINWYIEEHVQKTGVAIETQGFTFVISGRKRESLTGNATLHLYPHLSPLRKISGVVDYLTTEIAASKQKKFPLITFVDTPGLVDGDMHYPYDVNEAINWLGSMSDLIFVLFDPIGQALCKRTLNLVEGLNSQYPDRLRFYLSKADEAGEECDRQKVMMQIVQELCKRPGLNRTAFHMPAIYLPNSNKTTRCHNQIEEVCQDLELVINRVVQNTLNNLEIDCNKLIGLTSDVLHADDMKRASNLKGSWRALLLLFFGILIPVLFLTQYLLNGISVQSLHSSLGPSLTHLILIFIMPVRKFWKLVPEDDEMLALVLVLGFSLALLYLSRRFFRGHSTLSRKRRNQLFEQRDYLSNVVKSKKEELYHSYLSQSIEEHDL